MSKVNPMTFRIGPDPHTCRVCGNWYQNVDNHLCKAHPEEWKVIHADREARLKRYTQSEHEAECARREREAVRAFAEEVKAWLNHPDCDYTTYLLQGKIDALAAVREEGKE